jgi:hypothetical protein
MPDASGYASHLSSQAAAFIVGLPRRQQQKLLDFADQLANQPFQVGDYRLKDATGRDVETLLMDEFLFTYWVDHSAKEVRITEIIKV